MRSNFLELAGPIFVRHVYPKSDTPRRPTLGGYWRIHPPGGALIWLLLACVFAATGPAQETADPAEETAKPAEEIAEPADERLFNQEPFDRITLDELNDSAVLKVEPLKLPGRQLPEEPKAGDKLVVRLLDQPGQEYEIEWRSIAKVELFEQMVLAEARGLIARGQLDAVYDYFAFLTEKSPQLPGLEQAMQQYLYEEAKASHQQGRFDGALAMLREVYRRNPQWPGIDKALGLTTDKLVEKYLAQQKYRAAGRLLANLAAWFPQHPVVASRQGQLKQQAGALLAEARRMAESGRFSEAAGTKRLFLRIWPNLPGGREFYESLQRRYPRVIVGVSTPAYDFRPHRLDDWAARRAGRLLYRTLTEFAGPGTDGGAYHCPVGNISLKDLGRQLAVDVRPNVRWSSGEAVLTGYDVSRRMLAMADPAEAAYRVQWAEIFGEVGVRDVYHVEADLRRPHVHPEALLRTVLVPYGTADASRQPPLSNGPFVPGARTREDAVYQINGQYFAAGPAQPKEIVERHFSEGAKAIGALKRGEIHVLARVAPWGLDMVRADEKLVVEEYDVPLVHCLIPNMRRPLTGNRLFRRALVYAIHRQAILDHLLGGAKPPGCQVISGPFPAGRTFDDAISYAYDPQIAPRQYQPHLAIALGELAVRNVAEALKKKGKTLEEVPRLVLAHPADEIAQGACRSIRKQLELIGLSVTLREISGALPARIPEDVDLLYAELAMWEPVVDARRLLGHDGMAAGCSPYMSLALQKLEKATDWTEVSRLLRRMHRVAYDDVAVLPLWQLVDFLAYRKGLQGIDPRPITLYENVENWQPTFEYPHD